MIDLDAAAALMSTPDETETDPNAIISADDALRRQEELDKQFAAMAAETEEEDPNAIISADDALRRQEELDKQFAAMAAETEEEDPMAALLAADENDDDEATANHEESDYDPFAALDDFADQKEA